MQILNEQSEEYIRKFIHNGLRKKDFGAFFIVRFRKFFYNTGMLVKISTENDTSRICVEFDPEEFRKFVEDKDEETAENAFLEKIREEVEKITSGKSFNETKEVRSRWRKIKEFEESSREFFEQIAENSAQKSDNALTIKKAAKNRKKIDLPWFKKLVFFIENARKGMDEIYVPRSEKFDRDNALCGEELTIRKNLALAIDVTKEIDKDLLLRFFQKIKFLMMKEINVTIMECGKHIYRTYRFPPTKRGVPEDVECPEIKFLNNSEEFVQENLYGATEEFYDLLLVLTDKKQEPKPEGYTIPVMFLNLKER